MTGLFKDLYMRVQISSNELRGIWNAGTTSELICRGSYTLTNDIYSGARLIDYASSKGGVRHEVWCSELAM